MSKTPRQSRWFLFSVQEKYATDIRSQIIKSGCNDAQWCRVDDYIEGYLYFQSTHRLPKKKQWIRNAVFDMTTEDQLLAQYCSSGYEFESYGSNPLLVFPAAADENVIYNKMCKWVTASQTQMDSLKAQAKAAKVKAKADNLLRIRLKKAGYNPDPIIADHELMMAQANAGTLEAYVAALPQHKRILFFENLDVMGKINAINNRALF